MSGRYEKITDGVLADFQQKADEMKAKVLAAVDPEPGAFPGKCTSFLRRIERLGKLGVQGYFFRVFCLAENICSLKPPCVRNFFSKAFSCDCNKKSS